MAEYKLHTYFRSSCSGRVRIALNLKGFEYDSIPVNLLKGEQSSEEYLATNPIGLVPSFQSKNQDSSKSKATLGVLTQSMAILEYLEEAFPDRHPLLPALSEKSTTNSPNPAAARAHIRELANIIACDVQPVTNLRILRKIRTISGENADRAWAHEFITSGLVAYEKLAAPHAGKFSYGDEISLADVCLIPAIWGAMRFGVDLQALPTVRRVFENMSREEAVVRAHWQNQGDTPAELRQTA